MQKFHRFSTILMIIAGCLLSYAQLGYSELAHRVHCPNCSNFKDAVSASTSIVDTSNPLDLAIDGAGYFAVQLTDGSTAYTRYGHFHLDENDLIVTSDGYPVLPQITIPEGSTDITVSPTGEVSVIYLGSPMVVGQIQLTVFANPAWLQYIGNHLYLETPLSGTPITGNPGVDGFGTIEQGSLEVTKAGPQSRIFTALSDVVVTDPPAPDEFPGNELNPLNNDGNLGIGHNIYKNVDHCHAYPTTEYIGAGFGGSLVDAMPVFNYGQILVRSLLSESQLHHLKKVHVITFLAMSGYDDSYPLIGNLTIRVWNTKTEAWDTKYVNASFPIQTLASVNDPIQFSIVTFDVLDAQKYVDENGYINFFIYTPYSGTSEDQQNPAQINQCCFELCAY